MNGHAAARRSHRSLAGALLAGALLVAGACGRQAPTADSAEPLPPPDAVYTTRGMVRGLPAAPANELAVFHEAVPELVDRKGERSGMDSMTMPFQVAPAVSLDDLAVGDKVEITFELRWQSSNPLLITQLGELPADTELQLGRGAADPSTDAPAPVLDASPAPAVDPSPADGPDAADGGVAQGSSEAI